MQQAAGKGFELEIATAPKVEVRSVSKSDLLICSFAERRHKVRLLGASCGFCHPSEGNSKMSIAMCSEGRTLTSETRLSSFFQVAVFASVSKTIPSLRQKEIGSNNGNFASTTFTASAPHTPWRATGTSALRRNFVVPPTPTALAVKVGSKRGFKPCSASRSHKRL